MIVTLGVGPSGKGIKEISGSLFDSILLSCPCLSYFGKLYFTITPPWSQLIVDLTLSSQKNRTLKTYRPKTENRSTLSTLNTTLQIPDCEGTTGCPG